MRLLELKTALAATIEKSDERLLRMMLAMAKEYQMATPQAAATINPADKVKVQSNTDEDSDQLYRLVYTSVRTPSCKDDCIKDIMRAATKNNPALGLTGILIHTPTRFLQILEGPYNKVQEIYKKIEKDPRHGGTQMRYCQPAQKRHFGNWHMAKKEIGKNGIGFATAVSPEEKMLYNALVTGNLRDYKDDGMRLLKTFLMVS